MWFLANNHKLVVLLATVLAAASAFAQDFSASNEGKTIYYNITSPNTVEVAKSADYSGDIVIPGEVEYEGAKYTVTAIGDYAFNWSTRLSSVVMPGTVTTIGTSAFAWCSVSSVAIGESVEKIGSQAFAYCSKLKEVHISDISSWCRIKFTDDYANPLCSSHSLYVNGDKITDLEIPEGVTSIAPRAFCECSGLTSVRIPPSLAEIGENAFFNCTYLKQVDITDVAAWCAIRFGNAEANPLYYAYNLCIDNEIIEDLMIPEGVTSINDYAFCNYCPTTEDNPDISGDVAGSSNDMARKTFTGFSSLLSVDIPATVATIGRYAFAGVTSLRAVRLGNAVSDIGEYAFYRCSSLESVDVPNSVSHIGEYAFAVCFNLASATIGDNVTAIAPYAFYLCDKLESVDIGSSVSVIGEYAFYQSGLGGVDIPDSVTSIDDCAFSHCANLASVAFGASLATIGDKAFCGCQNLTSIELPGTIASLGRSVFQDCAKLTTVALGNSIAEIGSGTFYHCAKLASIDIPASVTKIGGSAFERCTSLASVSIPNSVDEIGYFAFRNCTSLMTVDLGEAVAEIGNYAFAGCNRLASIKVHCDAPADISLGSSVFYGVPFATCMLSVPEDSEPLYAEARQWQDFANIVGYDKSAGCVRDTLLEEMGGASAPYYDLAGRRIHAPLPGSIYIRSGKKRTSCSGGWR